jgi:hypothetical protein
MKASDNKVYILKDIEGNYAIDCHWEEKDLPFLKDALTRAGISEIIVQDDELSIQRNRAFTSEIPVVMRKDTKRINWETVPVIVELLCSKEMNDWEKTKKLCVLSGFDVDSLPEHRKPEGFISPRYSEINKHYEKWKRENNKTETRDTKVELVTEFAPVFIEEVRRKKLKRLPIGTKVIITEQNITGTIIGFREDSGEPYDIMLDDGFSGFYKRNKFEVVPDDEAD